MCLILWLIQNVLYRRSSHEEHLLIHFFSIPINVHTSGNYFARYIGLWYGVVFFPVVGNYFEPSPHILEKKINKTSWTRQLRGLNLINCRGNQSVFLTEYYYINIHLIKGKLSWNVHLSYTLLMYQAFRQSVHQFVCPIIRPSSSIFCITIRTRSKMFASSPQSFLSFFALGGRPQDFKLFFRWQDASIIFTWQSFLLSFFQKCDWCLPFKLGMENKQISQKKCSTCRYKMRSDSFFWQQDARTFRFQFQNQNRILARSNPLFLHLSKNEICDVMSSRHCYQRCQIFFYSIVGTTWNH